MVAWASTLRPARALPDFFFGAAPRNLAMHDFPKKPHDLA